MDKFLDAIITLIFVVFLLSLPITVLGFLATDSNKSVCDNYTYYTPFTFLACNITKERPK